MNYFATRKCILLGDRLWELDENELHARQLLPAGTFNRIQNIASLVPNIMLIICLDLFAGEEVRTFAPPAFSPYSNCDAANKFPVITWTFLVPIIVTWASPFCIDYLGRKWFSSDKDNQPTSINMYLYLNGAHTLTSKSILVALGTLTSLSWGYYVAVNELIGGDFMGASEMEVFLLTSSPLAAALTLTLIPIFLYVRFFLFRFAPQFLSTVSRKSSSNATLRNEWIYKAMLLALGAALYCLLITLPIIGHIGIWISRCGMWDGLSLQI